MDLLKVDTEKCVKCGLCVQACPSCILSMGEDGPKCDFDRGCMSCGHCVAICPMGALDNKYAPLAEQKPLSMPVLDSETAYNFLRMRRSVRLFKPEPPSEEEIVKLLDVCRYAPTAGNSQGMYYIVIRDNTTVLRAYNDRGQDIIARNAPMLIFATAKRLNRTGVSNAEQAWAYAELFAPTIGLGTTIAGFIQTCGIAGYQPLLDLVGVPPKFKICGTLMVGHPKYKFQRMVERQHLKVEFK